MWKREAEADSGNITFLEVREAVCAVKDPQGFTSRQRSLPTQASVFAQTKHNLTLQVKQSEKLPQLQLLFGSQKIPDTGQAEEITMKMSRKANVSIINNPH